MLLRSPNAPASTRETRVEKRIKNDLTKNCKNWAQVECLWPALCVEDKSAENREIVHQFKSSHTSELDGMLVISLVGIECVLPSELCIKYTYFG